MGYTTDFSGSLKVSGKITREQFEYINKFSDTRRMSRDVKKLYEMYKGKGGRPTNEMVEIDGVHVLNVYGEKGEFFVGLIGNDGDSVDSTVIDHNRPPITQPGLWCQWILATRDNDQHTELNEVWLEWDGGEKFYNYVEWLEYLIENFFKPWGHTLNGEMFWYGEETSDLGKIIVKNNKVKVKQGKVTYD